MIQRNELVSLLNDWLEPEKIKDHTVNGLQFEGKEKIKHIAYAVDVSLETLRQAAELNVDFLITHHGLIWGGLNKIISFDKNRIQILCDNQINLYCSHLPLDLHIELGNNAQLIELLGAKNTEKIFYDAGYYAEIGIQYNQLIDILKERVSNRIIEMNFGNNFIDKIAICSGGATLDLRALFEAYDNNVHTILSGETNSLYYHYAKELKMNIICCGHYATEIFGVKALGKKLQETYKNKNILYNFIDIPTGF